MATLKESFSKGLTAINVKTSGFMEESKCKTYIATLEKEIQTMKLNLGELVYAKSVAGESFEEQAAETIQKIQEKYEEIKQQKLLIEKLAAEQKQILGASQIDAVKYCAQCGAQNAGNYKFCSKCGAQLG